MDQKHTFGLLIYSRTSDWNGGFDHGTICRIRGSMVEFVI